MRKEEGRERENKRGPGMEVERDVGIPFYLYRRRGAVEKEKK